ncbi:hypothetical protein COX21_01670 [Candidatus Falkowbacteria bacterium CG23_combo_of_CG06-09_8_20_14_all_41_10]|uniref:DUF3987 domain-containing protein n=2 Tax=Patescibacteria group TaxID=1783273 RepID=A0A2G9ZQ11_9BACT|nr:MAG: hypothetical protein COX21_01670 [Candidatus Falkowbacteria bacterium CG23_combo_of_CG06-09_8_20_14_all_41_10]PIY72305.1 MAG: hypothetical protein COY87_01670 [Candidatus Roizmanbacteria bacterium CG_4_10_14_0_8_um_filter_33_9]
MINTNDIPTPVSELVKEEFKLEAPKAEDSRSDEKPVEIDVSKFKPITAGDLLKILGLTIKRDETNKLIAFLALLSAYTKDSQINISFNAPSSTGKSFIPTEIGKLFPEQDVIEVGYCSPTAFFHDYGVLNKAKKGYIVDLSRKILIFLDQPHTLLLQHLRPMLSHDKKEIRLKITDKSQKAGLRTKNIYLIGYPTVIFCTAGLMLDEQEATRFLLLSPEINQEKIREAIYQKIRKEADSLSYDSFLDSDPERKLLMERILVIRAESIKEIKIGSPALLQELFFKKAKMLKPRHQRDIGRIIGLIKVLALLNLWFRQRDGETLVANDDDIREAFHIWDEISESQELNLPPYVFNLYKDIILTAYKERNSELDGVVKLGLSRQDILQKHFQVYGRHLPDWQLRQQIIPILEASGLIIQEQDQSDKRKTLIYPTTPLTIFNTQNNSESHGGVAEEIEEIFGAKAI